MRARIGAFGDVCAALTLVALAMYLLQTRPPRVVYVIAR